MYSDAITDNLKPNALSHVLQWLVSSADFPQLLPPKLSKMHLI
jgi:hypothetical protein